MRAKYGLAVWVLGAAIAAPTAEAQADLQGTWHNLWVVSLERPTGVVGQALSEAQALDYADKNSVRPGGSMEAPFFGAETVTPLKVGGEYRSSVVIDPPDGRIPFTEEGLRRRAAYKGAGSDGPEARSVSERCLGGWGRAPILSYAVGNLRQIVQTRDSVAIWSDYNPGVRIVPLDGRPPARGASEGESTGRWEGETLAVDTTNFRADEPVRQTRWGSFVLRPQTRITERFTRVSEDEILYRFTVEDPVLYARAWIGESVFARSKHRVFEFACHEGNYGLANILSGARAVERRVAGGD